MPVDNGHERPGDRQRVSLVQRVLLRLPRVGQRGERPSFTERMERTFLKPADPAAAGATAAPPSTPEELDAAKLADDQERLIGLSLAPLAGLIAIVVTAHQLANNPPALLGNGRPNPAHVSVSLAHELEFVLLALAVVILVTSMLRRRLFAGIATALYGLAIFNLHWWGFGVPFLLIGSWFIVRAYRVHQAGKAIAGSAGAGGPAPRASKRYTPPTPPRRVPPSKPRRERDAG